MVKERAVNVLPYDQKLQLVNCLCNGMSLRAITRVTGVHRTTVMKLLVRVGQRCEEMSSELIKGIDVDNLQFDEIWTFCGKKQGRLNSDERKNLHIGDQYVFYALERHSKLVVAYEIGKRDWLTSFRFVGKVKESLNGCSPQISTDQYRSYPPAIRAIFGPDADYAAITKQYEAEHIGRGRYAPPRVSSTVKRIHSGNPDESQICTSHIERANLTMRTFQNRLTRLSVGFSRKIENLRAAVALHFTYYNFVWQPRTIKTTPAVAAGIVDSPWTVADLLGDC